MIYTGLGRVGEIADVKANGGADVAEVYGSIGESNPIYYKQREMVGTSPMQFKALGLPLKDYRIYGETLQDGTPSPDMPVDVVGCGEWDSVANSYKLPVTTTNGTDTVSTPIYIGSEPLHRIGEYADYVDYESGKIVKRIGKYVFTGDENIARSQSGAMTRMYYIIHSAMPVSPLYCTHFRQRNTIDGFPDDGQCNFNAISNFIMGVDGTRFETADDFKSYLTDQYTAGTPVTVWYVLSEPIEEDPPVSFPEFTTLSGTNTLTVYTTVKPSKIDLTGRIKPTGYGQLLDVNDVDIRDSNSTPIFIRG